MAAVDLDRLSTLLCHHRAIPRGRSDLLHDEGASNAADSTRGAASLGRPAWGRSSCIELVATAIYVDHRALWPEASRASA
jgi:hypothetical protein